MQNPKSTVHINPCGTHVSSTVYIIYHLSCIATQKRSNAILWGDYSRKSLKLEQHQYKYQHVALSNPKAVCRADCPWRKTVSFVKNAWVSTFSPQGKLPHCLLIAWISTTLFTERFRIRRRQRSEIIGLHSKYDRRKDRSLVNINMSLPVVSSYYSGTDSWIAGKNCWIV